MLLHFFFFFLQQARIEHSPLSYRIGRLQGLLILRLQLGDEAIKLWNHLLVDVENLHYVD
jgi:hypothetical protein